MPFRESIPLITESGEVECKYFECSTGEVCLVIIKESWEKTPFVRIHSACMFSESLHSNDCDCALQLNASMQEIAKHGGIVVYLFQEGRGIGLLGKMQAIRRQIDKGIDTAAAFAELGHKSDMRSYSCAAEALKALGVEGPIRLATNNPGKIREIELLGFKIESRVSLDIKSTEQIDSYREMKRDALGHLK